MSKKVLLGTFAVLMVFLPYSSTSNDFKCPEHARMLEIIYDFERMVNKEPCPSSSEFEVVISPNTEYEIAFILMECIEHGWTPCNSEKCLERMVARDKSLFFKFLRSDEGPFSGEKIKIFIYDNVSFPEDSLEHRYDAVILCGSKYIPATFWLSKREVAGTPCESVVKMEINGVEMWKIIKNYLYDKYDISEKEFNEKCGFREERQ